MKIEAFVKTALDELRMQMLGTQVLFGFQLQGAFQDGFADLPDSAKRVEVCALYLIVLTIALLIAVPSQHRFVEKGEATQRIARQAQAFAEIALLVFSVAMGCALYAISVPHWPQPLPIFLGGGLTIAAVTVWFGLGWMLRVVDSHNTDNTERKMPEENSTPLHAKIEQMLTEARVVLPGAQALIGFQFVVTLMKAFADLSLAMRIVHFSGLFAVALSVIFLIAPAAVHRITFNGMDVPRFHVIGSRLVTIALAPLAFGISADVYVATGKMLGDQTVAIVGAVVVALTLVALWYVLPLALKHRIRGLN